MPGEDKPELPTTIDAFAAAETHALAGCGKSTAYVPTETSPAGTAENGPGCSPGYSHPFSKVEENPRTVVLGHSQPSLAGLEWLADPTQD